MARRSAQTVLATYRVRRGKEAAFRRLLSRHWPVLRGLRLVTPEPPVTYEGRDASGRTFFVEVFTWRGGRAVATAHSHPAVARVWDEMGRLVEDRLDRPRWEFPHVHEIKIRHRTT